MLKKKKERLEIAGFSFKPKLWLKCQMCDRVVDANSKWIKWWLVGKRRERDVKQKFVIRCPQHVNRRAMQMAGAPGARAKGFKNWVELARDHYDDDPQPPPWVSVVFPNKEEYEYFVNTPTRVRW